MEQLESIGSMRNKAEGCSNKFEKDLVTEEFKALELVNKDKARNSIMMIRNPEYLNQMRTKRRVVELEYNAQN